MGVLLRVGSVLGVDAVQEVLGRVGAVHHGAVREGDAARQLQHALEEDGVHRDHAVHIPVAGRGPGGHHELGRAGEVGHAVRVARDKGHAHARHQGLADVALLIGGTEDVLVGEQAVVAGEVAQLDVAVRHGEGAAGAGEAARGADLGIALRDHQVGLGLAVRAQHAGEGRGDLARQVRGHGQLVQGRADLLERAGHLVQMGRGQGVDRGRGARDRGGRVGRRLGQGLKGRHVDRALGAHDLGEGRGGQAIGQGDQGLGREVVEHHGQRADAGDVRPVDGHIARRGPERGVRLLAHAGGDLGHLRRRLLGAGGIALLDLVLEGRELLDGDGGVGLHVERAAVEQGAAGRDGHQQDKDHGQDHAPGNMAAVVVMVMVVVTMATPAGRPAVLGQVGETGAAAALGLDRVQIHMRAISHSAFSVCLIRMPFPLCGENPSHIGHPSPNCIGS